MAQLEVPRGYLSASAIGTWHKCQRQFKFRYIDNIISPPNFAMVKGKASHNIFEDYYKKVMEGKNRPEPKEMKDMSAEVLEEEVKNSDLKPETKELDECKKELEIASESYISNIASNITPVGVEEEVRYESRCGVEILAYLDLIHEKEDYVITDYKLTGKKWGIGNLQDSLQFKIYSLVTGLSDIEIHNIVKTTKTPKIFNKRVDDGVLDVTSNIRLLNHQFVQEEELLEEHIELVAQAINTGIFPPTDPSNWWCSSTHCGYWHLCRGRKN